MGPLAGQEWVAGGISFPLVPVISAGKGCLHGEMGFVPDHPPHNM